MGTLPGWAVGEESVASGCQGPDGVLGAALPAPDPTLQGTDEVVLGQGFQVPHGLPQRGSVVAVVSAGEPGELFRGGKPQILKRSKNFFVNLVCEGVWEFEWGLVHEGGSCR